MAAPHEIRSYCALVLVVELIRAGLAGQMEADVMLEPAVALASGCMLLGMRLYALELCSVLLFVTKPLRYLATTYRRGAHTVPCK